MIALVVHGFGSSKESCIGRVLAKKFPAAGIGLLRFDLPAHGESPVDGTGLRIETCLDDIAAVEQYARSLAPEAEIVYFGSSFGAYLLLLYFSLRQPAGRKAYFRSAAVNMPAIMLEDPDPRYVEELEATGSFLLEEGYERPLRITQAFLADLAGHDVFRLYRPGMAEIRMVHGEADDVVPADEVRRFAAAKGIPLTVLPDGGHRLLEPGHPSYIAADAIRFFTGREK